MAAKTSIAKTITKLYYSSGSHSSHPKHLAPLSLSSSFSSSSPNAASPAAESQSTISSQAPGRERSRLSRWLLFLPGAITFGLGTWQIIRRQEKVLLSSWSYYIITPLIPVPDKDESVQLPILVNRGWVLRSWKDEASKVSEDGEQSSDITPSSVQETETRSWWRYSLCAAVTFMALMRLKPKKSRR